MRKPLAIKTSIGFNTCTKQCLQRVTICSKHLLVIILVRTERGRSCAPHWTGCWSCKKFYRVKIKDWQPGCDWKHSCSIKWAFVYVHNLFLHDINDLQFYLFIANSPEALYPKCSRNTQVFSEANNMQILPLRFTFKEKVLFLSFFPVDCCSRIYIFNSAIASNCLKLRFIWFVFRRVRVTVTVSNDGVVNSENWCANTNYATADDGAKLRVMNLPINKYLRLKNYQSERRRRRQQRRRKRCWRTKKRSGLSY